MCLDEEAPWTMEKSSFVAMAVASSAVQGAAMLSHQGLVVETISELNPITDIAALEEACFEARMKDQVEVADWLSDHVDVRAWLKHRGFDPDGNLVRQRDRENRTAVFATCRHGHLCVLKWLAANGAVETLRTPCSEVDGCFATPLWAAAFEGHLRIVAWLIKNGAGEDICRSLWDPRHTMCATPFLAACSNLQSRTDGFALLRVMFENGAAESIRVRDEYGDTPLIKSRKRADICTWLIINGAANGADGHASPDIMYDELLGQVNADDPNVGDAVAHIRIIRAYHDYKSRLNLCVDLYKNFKRLVLGAVCVDGTRMPAAHRPAIRVLRGHEESALKLIADFAGVVYGRRLRTIYECIDALGIANDQIAEEFTVFPSEGEDGEFYSDFGDY